MEKHADRNLMYFSFCRPDILLVFGNGPDGCLNAGSNVLYSQAGGGGRQIDYLSRREGNMHESAPDMGIVVGQGVEKAVHQVIADKGSG